MTPVLDAPADHRSPPPGLRAHHVFQKLTGLSSHSTRSAVPVRSLPAVERTGTSGFITEG